MRRQELKEYIKGIIREIITEEESSNSFKIPSLYNQFETPYIKNPNLVFSKDSITDLIKRADDKPDYFNKNKPKLKTKNYSDDWKGNLKHFGDELKTDVDNIKKSKTYKTLDYIKNVHDSGMVTLPIGKGSWKDPSKRKGTLSLGDIRNRIKGGDLDKDPIYGFGIDLEI